jgi:hypothetical protein
VGSPLMLSYLASAHAELGRFHDARRCLGRAMTRIETTEERLYEAEIYRMPGEIALKSPERALNTTALSLGLCRSMRAIAAV